MDTTDAGQWYLAFGRTHERLCGLGLYRQACEMTTRVLTAGTIPEAIETIEEYAVAALHWRSADWLLESGRVATELHSLGLGEQAARLMTTLAGAESEPVARKVINQYLGILANARRNMPIVRHFGEAATWQ